MQLLTRDPRTGIENPVSIKCAWPELVKTERRGKRNGFRSHLLGNRELDCRVVVVPPKRVSNAVSKMRQDIRAKKVLRNRWAFVANNPTVKVGAIKADGTIQPREKGKFLKKVQIA